MSAFNVSIQCQHSMSAFNVSIQCQHSMSAFNVSIQFTPITTYDQTIAIIGGAPYPWSCDGVPRTREPTPQSAFATRHYLLLSYQLLSYQTWDSLLHIASSPQAVSVDGTAPYPCP
jgi:hypothetical protein